MQSEELSTVAWSVAFLHRSMFTAGVCVLCLLFTARTDMLLLQSIPGMLCATPQVLHVIPYSSCTRSRISFTYFPTCDCCCVCRLHIYCRGISAHPELEVRTLFLDPLHLLKRAPMSNMLFASSSSPYTSTLFCGIHTFSHLINEQLLSL
jgi:hypothetical protein